MKLFTVITECYMKNIIRCRLEERASELALSYEIASTVRLLQGAVFSYQLTSSLGT